MRLGVLVFSEFPEGAALGRRAYLLSKGWAQLGHEVNVVVAQRFSEGPLREEFEGLRVVWGSATTRAEFHRLSERLKARWSTLRHVHVLMNGGLDWLVLAYADLDRLPYLAIARQRGVRIAVTYDDARHLPPQPSLKERWLALRGRLADRVIPHFADLLFPTSMFLDARLRTMAPNTPRCVLPAVVDTAAFKADDAAGAAFRDRWRLGNCTVLGYMGTYWYVEGVAVFLRAVAALRARGAIFKVVICGKHHLGYRPDDVPALIAELGLKDVVAETGWLSTKEVIGAMSASDVLVIPKLQDEANIAGLPAKLAEYMALGRAIVCSDVGDISLYVKDGEDVLLCRAGDPHALMTALGELLQNAELRRLLAANAREGALRNFDYRRVAEKAAAAMEARMLGDGDRRRARGSHAS